MIDETTRAAAPAARSLPHRASEPVPAVGPAPEPGPGPAPAPAVAATPPPGPASSSPAVIAPALLGAGATAWLLGITQIHRSQIGTWGLLAGANVWFVLGLTLLAVGLLAELGRCRSRTWVLAGGLVALIVAIHGAVPILFGTPEYAWVYKHLGEVAAFQHFGRVIDSTDIYQEWPVLFTAVAALARLAQVSPDSLALWAPVAFELAGAFLLLAIFRALGTPRRVAWLAVALYEALVSWVGQDYLSPQAFAYLLWLGLLLIVVRWLRNPTPPGRRRLPILLRARLLTGLEPGPAVSRRMRAGASGLAAVVFLAIVAAHQLTPYVVLIDLGALTLLGIIRPRWLVVMLGAIAVVYLIPRYSIVNQFGGLFSGADPIANASGARGTYHAGAEATTAQIVRGLAGAMWLAAVVAIIRHRVTLGRVAIPAVLAFAPFVILGMQSYGGEAIYRVYLFSCPWCALLIAGLLCELRIPALPALARWPLIGVVVLAALAAGLQGLYGPVSVDAFTPAELTASQWLFTHVPRGALVILPEENFPLAATADTNGPQLQVMPADPQLGESWMDEGDLREVRAWIRSIGAGSAYIVVSQSMTASAAYYGAPVGYLRLTRMIPTALRGTVVFADSDTTVYRLDATDTPAAARAGARASARTVARATHPTSTVTDRGAGAHRGRARTAGPRRRTAGAGRPHRHRAAPRSSRTSRRD